MKRAPRTSDKLKRSQIDKARQAEDSYVVKHGASKRAQSYFDLYVRPREDK